jgi:D-apionolactonase
MNQNSNIESLYRGVNFRLASLIVLLIFTSTIQAAEDISLRAGPVTMTFDVDNVFLRYVRIGPHEVLRGINAPVRDQNWATIAPKVSNLRIKNHGDSFQVTFDVHCQEADIDFRWKGSISGSAEGVVEFTFDGEAHSTFKRNRIGFCVLHGPSAAGQPWVIETPDGKKSKGHFPKFISPHQPAKNLRAITHEVAPGIRARVEFEGEVFEMEDQRNWTDASFKTYCTPLNTPYPVEVTKGTKISQKIRISLAGDRPNATPSGASGSILTLTKKESALPRLGVQVSGEVQNLSDLQLRRLKTLHLDHLRIDLALSKKTFVNDLHRATRQAKALGVSLHVGLNLGESPAFATLLKEIKNLQPPVSYWLVTGGIPTHFQMVHNHLSPVAGEAIIGVTRTTNFVDLNRARPDDKSIEAVGFAINPQIHAFDNASMVETLPIHADVVNSTRKFVGDCPLIIGPITLAPQFVNGEDPPGGPPAGPLPTYVDTRQVEPFTAAWTLGSIKYLVEAGAHSATYFETVGWNGIMDADDVGARPAAFPSRPGKLFPVYHLLSEIGEFSGGTVSQIDSSNTLAAVGLALRKKEHMRVLVGNLTAEPQTITLRGLSGKAVTIHFPGAKETHATPELAITLPPYGIVRIDQGTDQ